MSQPLPEPTGYRAPTQPGASLSGAAARGVLRMDPGVAERAAARCVAAYERVEAHRARLSGLARLQCGASTSGTALGDQLDAKLHGDDPGSVARTLYDQGRALLEMAEAYRAAGRATQAREQDSAAALVAAGAGPSG